MHVNDLKLISDTYPGEIPLPRSTWLSSRMQRDTYNVAKILRIPESPSWKKLTHLKYPINLKNQPNFRHEHFINETFQNINVIL